MGNFRLLAAVVVAVGVTSVWVGGGPPWRWGSSQDGEASDSPAVLGTFAKGNPVDLAEAPKRDIYVLDSSASTVTRYDRDGLFVSAFGSKGMGIDQMSRPQALAVARDGRIFVADTGNGRVQVYSADGIFQSTTGAGVLSSPVGVAVDGDLLAVSDAETNEVRFFGVGGDARGALPLENPRGMTASSSHRVLVASVDRGMMAFGDGELFVPRALADLPPEVEISSLVDIAGGSNGIAIAPSGDPSVILLDRDLRYRRKFDEVGTRSSLLAVLPGTRSEQESFYVADGSRVIEVSLQIPSPLPVLAKLREALARRDVEEALMNIAPISRPRYRELYEHIEADLPSEAAAMEDAKVTLLREHRAIAVFSRTEDRDGTPVVRRYNMNFSRGEDGAWQVLEY